MDFLCIKRKMLGNNNAGGDRAMKKKLPEDSVFKKKGFFVALYSCVAVVVVLGAAISVNNFRTINRAKEQQQLIDDQLEKANANTTKSYQTAAEQAAKAAADLQAQKNAEARQKAETEAAQGYAFGSKTPAPAATVKPAETAAPAPSAAATVVPEKSTESTEDLAAPVFEYFKDGDTMDWPVVGEIVMDYSVDHALYDKTLDQYRTNEDIRIAAKPGTPVKASSSGVVTKVEKSRKDGNAVTIDNGNGWSTYYGQLMDGVLVKEGDVVKAGQVIGGVSSPTIYGVLLGNHLIFKVTKDDATIDPKTILASRD
jgi:murein DD-endopeptidase MepM/ murein hydrolase activator NlpD